jgi:hypothetical protein
MKSDQPRKAILVTRQEIIDRARDVVQRFGGQVKVAEALGVKQPSVSKALRADDTSMDALRARILSELGGYEVMTETFFQIVPPRKKTARAS